MQCLAPLEPREAGPRGAAVMRFPWFVVVVAVSIALGLVLLMNWREVIATLHRHTVLQAELAICAGTLAGLYLSRMEVSPVTRRRIAALDALYERAASAPVHLGQGYTHYLPCVVLMTDLPGTNLVAELRSRSEGAVLKAASGGVLYIGPKGVLLWSPDDRVMGSDLGLFTATTPSKGRSLFPSRSRPVAIRPTMDLGPVRQVTAESIAFPQGQFARVARIQPKYAMHIRWPTGQALVAVPSIADTLPRLHRCLDELRWTAGASRPRE
jgi:hypothetical protein